MIIEWHCRGCDEKGTQEMNYLDVVQGSKGEETLLEFIQRKIKHKCKNTNIGVRLQHG